MKVAWLIVPAALTAAPHANAEDPIDPEGAWVVDGHQFVELQTEWELSTNEEVAGAEMRHVVFTPVSALPDSVSHSYLIDGTSTELARWDSVVQERVRAIDLDADGNTEIVRDIALPAPCGLFAWREPAVLEEGAFLPIVIGATANTEQNLGRVGSPPASVLSHAFDSSDRYLADSSHLTDGDPATAWVLGGGAGAWVALRAPEGARIGGVRLSSDESSAPLTVSVRFGDGVTQTLQVDGLHREYAIRTESRCALVSVADLGGREQLVLTEASLVSSTDGLPPAELVDTFWRPSLEAACAAERDTSDVAAELAQTDPTAAAAVLRETGVPCVAAALAQSLANHDPTGHLRLTQPMSEPALAALQTADFDSEAIPALIELSEQDPGWMTALQRAAEGSSGLALDALFRGVDEARFEAALALAPVSAAVTVEEMVSEDSADAWIRALRIALAFETPAASADSVREALAHDNGTVARLGIRLASALRTTEFDDDLTSIAERDPSSVLRAAAIVALSQGGHPVVERHAQDSAPDVRASVARLAAATEWLLEDPTRLGSTLTDENWPEVRAAWLHSASRADGASLDDVALSWLIESGSEDDIAAFFLALRVRGTSVAPAAIDLMIANDDSRRVLQAGLGILRFAEVLPRQWLESLSESAGYSEQMAPIIEALLE